MRIDIKEQGVVIQVSKIEFRGVEYNISSQSCYIHVLLVDAAGTGAYSYFIPFRYDGDWLDDDVKLYALNHLEDVDLDGDGSKEFTSANGPIPDIIQVEKSWWEYLLFWK